MSGKGYAGIFYSTIDACAIVGIFGATKWAILQMQLYRDKFKLLSLGIITKIAGTRLGSGVSLPHIDQGRDGGHPLVRSSALAPYSPHACGRCEVLLIGDIY